MIHPGAVVSALVLVALAVPLEAYAAAPLPDPPPVARGEGERGSLWSTQALGPGNVAMSMGGGVAVILPFYGLEAGVGVSDSVDIVGRFETVLGIFHYPYLGVRWMPLELGTWRLGARLHTHYSFFGIETDQLNFTSTFYLSSELGISGPITDASELMFAAGGEVDFFEYRVEDDEGMVVGDVRYDATNLRGVFKTELTDDLDGYAHAKLRIPTETFSYEATSFYVIPFLEIGGAWTF